MTLRVLLLSVCLLVAACAASNGPVARTDELPFDQAADVAAEALTTQVNQLPAFLSKIETTIAKRSVIIDNALDSSAGQQTALTKRLNDRIVARFAKSDSPFSVLPYQAANVGKATYLVTGTISRTAGPRSPLQINLALSDLKSGTVVAQASSRARDENLDQTPDAYYVDSPMVMKDARVEGQIQTSKTPPGNPSSKSYIEQVPVGPLLAEAEQLYNSKRYDEALAAYLKIPLLPNADQLEVFSGIYMTYVKKNMLSNAEPYFGRMVALGIKNNNLSVRFLFDPGKTEFVQDPVAVTQYRIWLRQIARQVAAAKVCVNVVGHTSHTGSVEFNDRLSAARATEVARRLVEVEADLASRMKTTGVGFRENLSGKGTDDRQDVFDRRVEFKLERCA